MAATINDYFPEAVSPAQVFVIDGLESFLSDDVPGPVTFLAQLRFVQLLGADFADVTKHVGKHAIGWITPLWGLLDAQCRQLQLMRVHPGNITLRSAFLNQNRFERGL